MESLYLTVPALVIIAGMAIAMNKVIKEMTEAIKAIKLFLKKYRDFFIHGNGKDDFLKMEKEVDQALEAIADLLDKFKLKKYSKILRGVIK